MSLISNPVLMYYFYQIKSLLLSHHTAALVSEILESVLQTVQKHFTYRQYILTDLSEDNVQNTHTYTQYTQCTIKTYLQLHCSSNSRADLTMPRFELNFQWTFQMYIL